MNKKICFITSTRAEYGLLKPVMELVRDSNKYELQIVVTGMHLSPEFGETYKEIEKDGFLITDKIEILLSSDTSVGIAKSMGLSLISFSEVLGRLKPDLLVVLGDRYEIFSMCSAAVVMRIPIVHLHGGETTEGAYDEVFRHCITKMSYLHFTSTDEYRKRVIQLGEDPKRVFNVGSLGVENVLGMKLLSITQLEESLNFNLRKPYCIVTFHPVTLESEAAEKQTGELLMALDKVKDMNFIFTKANSDNSGRIINKMIGEFVKNNSDRSILFDNLGTVRYLSAMKYCSCVVGNSSSGVIEAPSFYVPTVNIGDRQKGRTLAKSIINCPPKSNEIYLAIKKVVSIEFREEIKSIINPYEKKDTAKNIYLGINNLFKDEINIKKIFYDIN